ncbi:YadA C-terminal domain-containing protein [Fusobacterium nucleatum]|uniref:YadA C-terminal domain-containing protein n=1 Tax=Fusobacterium nucleatum TaxID=851 RepID=UPI0030D3F99B
MKNKLFDIILFVFLLNNINIFSSNDTIKEVEPIESIHSDEKKSVSSDISEESILEAPRKDYTSDELKTTNIISTNKDLKTNKKEENSREDKFEEITDRTNRITALGSAMGAVDLSKIPTKKFRVGAGVGHSAKNQAVAVGIGYAPTERLRLNTKVSTTTNSTKSNRSNGISIGASYDLDW